MDRKKQRDMFSIMQRSMVNRAIEPIKELVKSGQLQPDDALVLVAQDTKQFSDDDFRPEYKRFVEHAGKLFEGEPFFESGYEMTPAFIGRYKYRPSSHVDCHFLFKLWEHTGRQEYDSPEQLRKVMQGVLEGKRLLEIGCGPGFGLDVFKRLGAKPVGVELRRDYKGRVQGVDIRYGDARDLETLCGNEQFDLTYSKDFFATACIEEVEANKVATGLFDATVDGGSGFHIVTYQHLNPIVVEFMKWAKGYKAGDPDMFQRVPETFGQEEADDMMEWTNKCSLDPQYLTRRGFKITEYGIEDGDLIIVTTKPAYTH